jgi:photosystem II stability/assembly factor-like uncharacterized protein
MKKCIVVLATVGLLVLSLATGVFALDLTWEDIGRGNLSLKTVLVETDNSQIIYIGSEQGIFKSEDEGESWRSIFSARGTNRGVNFLLFASDDKNSLYAATGNGLFYSANQGNNWKRIFRGKNYLENECTTLAIMPYGIYLGTKQGLFVSRDKGRSWHKEGGVLGNTQILAVTYNQKEPNQIYIACMKGVFKSKDSGQSWERTFISYPAEGGFEAEEIAEEQGEEEKTSGLRYISIDLNNANYLYLATSRGVYISQDKGQNWESLSSFGLLNRDVKFLLVSSGSSLYAVTKSGVFEFTNNRWQELSLGLLAGDVRFLALDKENNLYAACDKGLFKAKMGYPGNDRQDNPLSLYFKNEPTINEVQQAAIKYAEVEPGKIKEWRKKAQTKALLPKLTVGLDRSENTNYEIYTSATTHYLYEGPDDKASGWDVTLSWDLGDLIWSEAQTSIDVRSRLMVELRGDILDEVTKLYFERLRVKMELDNLSLEDRKKRFEKELRLQELTASIDALTGGYFSQQMKVKI